MSKNNLVWKIIDQVLEEVYWTYQAIGDKLARIHYRPEPGKRALLVSQDDFRTHDVVLMNALLRRCGYERKIIRHRECTEKTIVESIDQLARESDADSQTVFFYAGHGHDAGTYYSKGVCVNGNPTNIYEKRMTPFAILQLLGKIKGKKAVIIDSCYSGEFVDEVKDKAVRSVFPDMINDYVVLAACPADNATVRSEGYAKGWDIGPLTAALYYLIGSSKGPVNLAKAEIPWRNSESYIMSRYSNEAIGDIEKSVGASISFEMQRASDTDFFLQFDYFKTHS